MTCRGVVELVVTYEKVTYKIRYIYILCIINIYIYILFDKFNFSSLENGFGSTTNY